MQLRNTSTILRNLTLGGLLCVSAAAQIQLTGPTSVATGQRADGLVFADFDGNGTQDMAVTTDGTGNLDLIEVFSGDGVGGFTPAGTVFLGAGTSPSGLAAADFDGDGDMDLAVTLQNANQVQMVQNLGAMSFAPGAATAAGGAEPRQVTAVDMTGNGSPDLVVTLRDSSSIAVIRNTAGTFSLLSVLPAGDDVRDHAVGDFNGDGAPDVAASSHDDRTVRILNNTGLGSLVASQTLFVGGEVRPSGLTSGDVDGDGDMDVVAAAGDDDILGLNAAAIYFNQGGTFTGPVNVPTGGMDADDVVLADFSGDGALDLAVSNQVSGTISLMENAGAGTFGAATFLTAGVAPGDLVAADLDGNGGVDLGALNRQAGGVNLFQNANGGTPQIGTSYCAANANSTGLSAVLTAAGSNLVAANNLTLTCSNMPVGQFAFFINSQTQGFVANPGGSTGNLCLGGMIGRMNSSILQSDATGQVTQVIDLTALPTPGTPVAAMAGQTWNFQCWFRDGMAMSNFSDGYSIAFQ